MYFKFIDLKVVKCYSLSSSRSEVRHLNTYSLNGANLVSVDSMKDLGVIFDYKLNFSEYVTYIIHKSLQLIRFISRSTKEFHSIDISRTLYSSLISSTLMYVLPLWLPYFVKHIDMTIWGAKYANRLNFDWFFNERLKLHKLLVADIFVCL